MAFTKNIVTDYGAVGDGVANDRDNVLAFKTAAAGLDSVLTGPSAKNYYIGPKSGGGNEGENYLFAGIPTLEVDLSGSTLTDNGTDNDFHFGTGTWDGVTIQGGFYQNNAHSAAVETVNAGASTVTLITSGDQSKVSVGDWVRMTGYALQGPVSFPINHHFAEFAQVASKQTSVLPYTVTFTAPLRNSYKSTWPDWGAGSASEQDYGGPAKFYVMHPDWAIAHVYKNFGVNKTGGPNPIAAGRKSTNASGRSVTFQNVTPTNYDGINPSASALHSLINCDYSAVTNLEVDKNLDELSISGSTMHDIGVQSSSVDLLTLSNSTVNTLLGTPKRTVISSSTVASVYPGAYDYGRSDSLTITDSVVSIQLGGNIYQGGNAYLGDNIGVDNGLNTMTAGVIRIPRSYTANAVNWAVPGTWCMWQDADRVCIKMFRVIDVTADATYIYIQTSESGTWPSYNTAGGGKLYIRNHPCPSITVTNSSDTAPAGTNDRGVTYGLNSAPRGAPLYSYAKSTVFNGAVQSRFISHVWGALVTLKVNVLTPYTGASSLSFSPVGDASSGTCYLTKADGSTLRYGPTINAKIAGERIMSIVNGAAVITGTQSLDSFAAGPDIPMWFANTCTGFFTRDISGESSGTWPSISVEITTDQGIPYNNARISGRLGLRLRAA